LEKGLNLLLSPSPHLHSRDDVSTAMRDVIISLIPVALVSTYFFKLNVPFLILVCVVTAMLTEVVFRRIMRKESQLKDGSAILTGFLVALCFSAATPWWLAAVATFIAVGLAKEMLGGLGWNRFNPALFGRVSVILLAPWITFLNTEFFHWRVSFPGIDTISQATPLALLQMGLPMPNMGTFFFAYPGGGMAETSAFALCQGSHTVCTFCGVGCGIICHVRDGKIINAEGDPDHPINEGALCSKGSSIYNLSYMYDSKGNAKPNPKR
jgi:Na+-translocating ferredoxin:NAD+ oxidoreductase subunit D